MCKQQIDTDVVLTLCTDVVLTLCTVVVLTLCTDVVLTLCTVVVLTLCIVVVHWVPLTTSSVTTSTRLQRADYFLRKDDF